MIKQFIPVLLAALSLSVTSSNHAAIPGNSGSEVNSESSESSKSQPSMHSAVWVIKGKVIYTGTVPARKKIEISKDVSVCGKVPHYIQNLIVAEDKGLANVLVGLAKVEGGKSLESLGTEFKLDQNGCTFIPHVLLAPISVKVKIKNSDGILHNIHTYSKANPPVNKAQPRFLKVLYLSFEKPEIVRMACDVHSWMSCYIAVVEHPYYAITDAKGNFVSVQPSAFSNQLLLEWSNFSHDLTRVVIK